MRLLVLGGTVFLSRRVAEEALARDHDVTVVSRGATGSPPEGARHVIADRDAPLPAQVTGEPYDVVVDVAGTPSHVRSALEQVRAEHWIYVSTCSVYADDATPNGGPDTLPLHEPLFEDSDDMADYGRLKVGCERLVQENAATWTIVRPGLIVGRGDRSGRFTYWVDRMRRARDGEVVLAPGDPADPVQFVDVRDLAAWIGLLAETRPGGVYDAIGPAERMDVVLDAIAMGCGVQPKWRWASRAQLEAAGVNPWAGPRSLPLWLPRPEYDGMQTHVAAPALDAGLVIRPVADTARDTLAWLEDTPDAVVTGLTAQEEADVLARLG